MKRLSEFFTTDNYGNPCFFTLFDSSSLQRAHFNAYWGNIDRMIHYQHGKQLVSGEPNTVNPILSDYMQYVYAWYLTHLEDLNRIYDTSIATYNPLDNYAMTEEQATARERGEIQNSTDSDVKPRVSTNYTSTNDDKTSGRLEGYNVSGILDTGYSPKSNGTENSTSKSMYNNTVSMTADTISATGHEVETIQHKRAGNIGTVTSQDMLNAEYDARERGFIDIFIKMFARDCLSGLFAVDKDGWCGI